MKKMLCLLLTVLLAAGMSLGAVAETTSALDAFYSLTGEKAQMENVKTTDQYLAEIVTGAYSAAPTDAAAAEKLAAELPNLSAVASRDIAAYAAANKLSVAQVRNAYYRALANVVDAEIKARPATDERVKNVQVILSLFLEGDDSDQTVMSSREAIRKSMTREHAATIAKDYQLPTSFVEFIMMDDNWDDDRWDNDDDWKVKAVWADETVSDDGFSELAIGAKDAADSTRVAELQEKLIALGYLVSKADGVFSDRTQTALKQFQLANGLPSTGVYGAKDDAQLRSADVVARWDYQDSFDDTPDNDNTPDNNTPDRDNTMDNTPNDAPDNTPDNTPDRNSPDNSPAATKAPARNNSPDNSPDNSPAATKAPARNNSPDNSPDNSPAATKAPSKPKTPAKTKAPVKNDSPDSPDYDSSDD